MTIPSIRGAALARPSGCQTAPVMMVRLGYKSLSTKMIGPYSGIVRAAGSRKLASEPCALRPARLSNFGDAVFLRIEVGDSRLPQAQQRRDDELDDQASDHEERRQPGEDETDQAT